QLRQAPTPLRSLQRKVRQEQQGLRLREPGGIEVETAHHLQVGQARLPRFSVVPSDRSVAQPTGGVAVLWRVASTLGTFEEVRPWRDGSLVRADACPPAS